jgi:lactoylglutathione lyase
MKGISSIAHVALTVRDIERSLDFYVNRLGFQEMFRLRRGGALWIVYLRITDNQYLELFPDGADERAPGPDATGVNHVCLGVDDIDAVIAELADAGIPLASAKKMGADHNWQAWIADPDGNRIELMQTTPNAMQLAAISSIATGGQVPPVYDV